MNHNKNLLTLILCFLSINLISQGKTLVTTRFYTPKLGCSGNFEAKWKYHLQNFHSGKPISVYELRTGERAGSYLMVQGFYSWAMMDSMLPAPGHSADIEKNIDPFLDNISGVIYYRYIDSLSYRTEVSATKFDVLVLNLKSGKFQDFTAILKRFTSVYKSTKDTTVAYAIYSKQLPGSNNQIVLVGSLKNGWKEMEMTYSTDIKAAYIKKYTKAVWDKDTKNWDDFTQSSEEYLMALRPDLSVQ
jgi:hypothetical protein